VTGGQKRGQTTGNLQPIVNCRYRRPPTSLFFCCNGRPSREYGEVKQGTSENRQAGNGQNRQQKNKSNKKDIIEWLTLRV
jgi:hypothetical protein